MSLLQKIVPYDVSQIVWYNVVILTIWHIGFLYAAFFVLPTLTRMEVLTLWISLWWFSGLGITAGSHRLWSHKSYEAKLPLRVFLMLANSMAFQGSIFEWSRDHRVHHKGSETEADPHNATRGLFFSHVGWVMVRKHPKVISEGKKISMSDLLDDVTVKFQKDNYLPLVLLMCYLLPVGMGYFLFGSASKGFWIGGIFRHVWVLHMTWFVNSVAHMWGERPYAPSINPAENLFVSICAIGEGWHNYHHKYPSDYSTSEWGISSGQWNPTTLFIDVCAMLGLAYNLKRSRTAKATRERIAAEKQKERIKNEGKKDSSQNTISAKLDSAIGKVFFGRSEEQLF